MSSNRVLLFAILSAAFVLLSSCQNGRMSRAAYKLAESTIQLPAELSLVTAEGEIIDSVALEPIPKLVIFIDSTECRMCRISKLQIYHPLYELSKQQNFQLMILVGGFDYDTIPISRIISDYYLEIPVYIDKDDVFRKLNPVIPNDSRLHSFLIDKDNQVLFIGDPSSSKHLHSLFLSKLAQL